jgi:P27 family predicted phage terminase small subunit
VSRGGHRPNAGRPRLPAEVHEARGTFRADRHAASAALPVNRERPKAPPHLSTSQRRAWRGIVDDLEQLGILAHSDGYVIEVAARQLGLARDSARAGQAALKAADYDTAHKCFKLEADCLNRGKSAAEQLGLSPSARHRLGMQLQRAQGGTPAAATPSAAGADTTSEENERSSGPTLSASPRLTLAPPAEGAA